MSQIEHVVLKDPKPVNFMDEIIQSVPIGNMYTEQVLDFAKEMSDKLVMPNGTSSDLTLNNKEHLILSLLVDGKAVYVDLNEFICNKTRVIKNIERFLIGSFTVLYIVHRRELRHKHATVTHTYAVNGVGQLDSLYNKGLAVYSFADNKMRFIPETIYEHAVTKLWFEPECRTDRVSLHYTHNVSNDVKRCTVRVPRKHSNLMYSFSELLAGFKISNDLTTIKVQLAIDPTISYTLPNPWVIEAYNNRPAVQPLDLLNKLRMLTEIYKLDKLLPSLGIKTPQLLDKQIKLFGVGRFFVYYPEHIKDAYLVKLNKLYRAYGIDTFIKKAHATSRHAWDRHNRHYVEFNFK